jgi:hypothetical protein
MTVPYPYVIIAFREDLTTEERRATYKLLDEHPDFFILGVPFPTDAPRFKTADVNEDGDLVIVQG